MRDGADGLALEHVAGKSGGCSSNARAQIGRSLGRWIISWCPTPGLWFAFEWLDRWSRQLWQRSGLRFHTALHSTPAKKLWWQQRSMPPSRKRSCRWDRCAVCQTWASSGVSSAPSAWCQLMMSSLWLCCHVLQWHHDPLEVRILDFSLDVPVLELAAVANSFKSAVDTCRPAGCCAPCCRICSRAAPTESAAAAAPTESAATAAPAKSIPHDCCRFLIVSGWRSRAPFPRRFLWRSACQYFPQAPAGISTSPAGKKHTAGSRPDLPAACSSGRKQPWHVNGGAA